MSTLHPCYGRADLFDSEDLHDHEEAKKLCLECPAAAKLHCAEALKAAKQMWGYDYHCGPRGTWAGQLVSPANPRNKKAAA